MKKFNVNSLKINAPIKPSVKIAGKKTSVVQNPILSTSLDLGVSSRNNDITEAIEKRLLSLGVELEFVEESTGYSFKTDDDEIDMPSELEGILDFNRVDEKDVLSKTTGISKLTPEQAYNFSLEYTGGSGVPMAPVTPINNRQVEEIPTADETLSTAPQMK